MSKSPAPQRHANQERIDRIREVLVGSRIDALLCVMPSNVLLVSGYWPVVGTALALAMKDGRIVVLAPADEADLVRSGWCDDLRTYSSDPLLGPAEAVREPLAAMLHENELRCASIALDDGTLFEESTYAATFRWRSTLSQMIAGEVPGAILASGAGQIATLRSSLTPYEADRVATACEIANHAYCLGSSSIAVGASEAEIAAGFEGPMTVLAIENFGAQRSGAYVWCMSGPNSAKAGAAYARTGNRRVSSGDLVLVHCNSYIDGFWTDITRTYVVGKPDRKVRAMYRAIFEARESALAAIRPGAMARDVDEAARRVLQTHGFGDFFTHGLGHNVGFSAISPDFSPRLHPASTDRLEIGATFNIEPSIYIRDFGGIRHCDVVTVTANGPEVLTPFHDTVEQLIISVTESVKGSISGHPE